MYVLRASFVTIVFGVSVILRWFCFYSVVVVVSLFRAYFFSFVCLKFIKLPPLQALSLDYFLRGFSSYHTREWIAIILIAFKFLDLKALCVAVSRFVCACAHLLATTVSFSYFVQHIPLSTVRVLFQYKLTHTHSNSAHERAIRFFRRSIFFPSLNSLGLSVLVVLLIFSYFHTKTSY